MKTIGELLGFGLEDENYICHYGTPRHSGRYPWGSGKNPYQRSMDFQARNADLKKQGFTEVERAKLLGCKNTDQLRAKVAIAKNNVVTHNAQMTAKLKEKGWSNVAIAKRLGISEGAVRDYIKRSDQIQRDAAMNVTEVLKTEINKQTLIDIGKGTELHMGVSDRKLKTAVEILKEEGYNVYNLRMPQMGTDKMTTMSVLCPPGMTWKEMYEKRFEIGTMADATEKVTDGGNGEIVGVRPIQNVDRSRVYIRYAEDGGKDKDGIIELRRGVDDLDMGESSYSQVRIGVDGTHYMKGMAVYSDNIPKGYDMVFNTNKTKDVKFEDVLKEQKPDPNNPFGATIKPDGQRGALNIVREEGEWDQWSKNLPSQFLSKQPIETAKRQLDLAIRYKDEEFEEIMSINNPTVRKKMLYDFAEGCDADAVHLKAAAMPRQATKVILPIPDLADNEVYAPTFENGEPLVLIRFPHGGKFEIPEVTVNNKIKGSDFMKNAPDAIGVSPKTASILSGADFDGDTVLAIPNRSGSVKTAPPLEKLKNFDPAVEYPPNPASPPWKKSSDREQREMGKVSNLITDMTIKGATSDELARAVRHSMVVIDVAKHHYDYKASEEDNGIKELKAKYQGVSESGAVKGASTLISRSKAELKVTKRSDTYEIDPETGEKIYSYGKDPETGKKRYTPTPTIYINKAGKVVEQHTASTRMAEAKNAYELMSDAPAPIEKIYADYANTMKAYGNKARKEYMAVQEINRDPAVAKQYAVEVQSLYDKLAKAESNAPIERKAQRYAGQLVQVAIEADPSIKDNKDALKKKRGQSLVIARKAVGANKDRVKPTDKEWEAIQKGAISKTMLKKILNNADSDRIMELAMPKTTSGLTVSKLNTAESLLNSGWTLKEVADHFNVSPSTLSKELKGEK